MSEEKKLFKDLYSPAIVGAFGDALKVEIPALNKKKFLDQVFDKDWKDKELKQRMRHISVVLNRFLPAHFPNAAEILVNMVEHLRSAGIKENTIEYMSLPDYVEVYGIEHFNASVKAIEKITQFTSCEFAVRPFILKYPDRMIKQMTAWGNHKSHKVRRLASEGCRPRLPWAMAIPALKKDPAPILPLLEKLKDDPHEWVRLSVANNLNDISKDNPELVLRLFKKWHSKSKETDWVLKHASRTLLKQGHTEILSLFGFEHDNTIELKDLVIQTPKVKMGAELVFNFTVKNKGKQSKMIRLEYGMYYKKANGSLSKKVFKISERVFQPGEIATITRRQSFRPITTRVYHTGNHKVSVIVNGVELATGDFELLKS